MVGEGVQGELGLGLKVSTGNTAALESRNPLWSSAGPQPSCQRQHFPPKGSGLEEQTHALYQGPAMRVLSPTCCPALPISSGRMGRKWLEGSCGS